MSLHEDDVALLKDIIDYSIKIIKSTKGVKYYYFESNSEKIAANERYLHIIGEAARKISNETRTKLANIPWKKMIGLRNKLAHDYGEILISRIWLTSQTSIPELVNELQKIDELKEYIQKVIKDV